MLMRMLLKICQYLFRPHRELGDLKKKMEGGGKRKRKRNNNVSVTSNVTLGIVCQSGSDRNQIARGSGRYSL